MRKARKTIEKCLAVLLFLGCVTSAVSAEQATDKLAKAPDSNLDLNSPKVQATSDLEMARTLIVYGRSRGLVSPLVTAAEILIDAPVQPLAAKAEQGEQLSQENVDHSVVKKPAPLPSAVDLLDEAAKLAEGQPELQAYIASLRSEAAGQSRARVGGPGVADSVVGARSRDIYTQSFYGGQMASVALVGDGTTDLDLLVYDPYGTLVGSSADYSDRGFVAFWVPQTGPYKIIVVNNGYIPNAYGIAAD